MRVGVAEAPDAAWADEVPLAGPAVFGAETKGAKGRSPGVGAPEDGRGRAGDAAAAAACRPKSTRHDTGPTCARVGGGTMGCRVIDGASAGRNVTGAESVMACSLDELSGGLLVACGAQRGNTSLSHPRSETRETDFRVFQLSSLSFFSSVSNTDNNSKTQIAAQAPHPIGVCSLLFAMHRICQKLSACVTNHLGCGNSAVHDD